MYQIKTDNFTGPLDLLLSLIEDNELDITQVSLAKVTDQYLEYVNQMEEIKPAELADFLVVAARLLHLKSRAILPTLDEEEEGEDLALQLRMYKEFVEAAKVIEKLVANGKYCYSREKMADIYKPIFNPPPKITLKKIKEVFEDVLSSLEPLLKLPEKALEKVITLQEKIGHLKELISQKSKFTFGNFINLAETKNEMVISFMAMLELLKREEMKARQKGLFDEIFIERL